MSSEAVSQQLQRLQALSDPQKPVTRHIKRKLNLREKTEIEKKGVDMTNYNLEILRALAPSADVDAQVVQQSKTKQKAKLKAAKKRKAMPSANAQPVAKRRKISKK